MTYKKALKEAYSLLKLNPQISNPYLETEFLLSKVIKKKREYFLAHSEEKINLIKYFKFKYLIKKRFLNYPLAYLLKEKNFYNYNFKVNKHTLIPRPETEMIIDEILTLIENDTQKKYEFLDIGTGSGNIIISLFLELKKKNLLRNIIKFWALDISSKALKIAKINASKYKIEKEISFLKGNLLKPFFAKENMAKNLIISANLPYLTPRELKHQTIQYEPKLALLGGLDGLKYYHKLLKQIKNLKKYKTIHLFMEINNNQKNALSNMVLSFFKKAKIEIKKDQNDLFRLVYVEIN